MTKKRVSQQATFFKKISQDYSDLNALNVPIMMRVKKIVDPYIKGNTLDIGNGGIISYDLKNVSKLLLADIVIDPLVNPKILKAGKLQPLKKTKFKYKKMSVLDLGLPPNTFDTVVMFTVAHHLAEKNIKVSEQKVDLAFKQINRVLKKGGNLVIAECCPTVLYEIPQALFFSLAYKILIKFGKPLPYFLSKQKITDLLENNKFKIVHKELVPSGQAKVYLPVFSKLSPPGWMRDLVLSSWVFVAKKAD